MSDDGDSRDGQDHSRSRRGARRRTARREGVRERSAHGGMLSGPDHLHRVKRREPQPQQVSPGARPMSGGNSEGRALQAQPGQEARPVATLDTLTGWICGVEHVRAGRGSAGSELGQGSAMIPVANSSATLKKQGSSKRELAGAARAWSTQGCRLNATAVHADHRGESSFVVMR